MLRFEAKPVVRFRNGNANIKGEMLALIHAINPREPSAGEFMLSQVHITQLGTSAPSHVAFFCGKHVSLTFVC